MSLKACKLNGIILTAVFSESSFSLIPSLFCVQTETVHRFFHIYFIFLLLFADLELIFPQEKTRHNKTKLLIVLLSFKRN